MAEPSSSNNTRKRHKPIQPPSPEQRRHSESNNGHYYQRPRGPPRDLGFSSGHFQDDVDQLRKSSSSPNNTRKRHKPIEPPSPEPKRQHFESNNGRPRAPERDLGFSSGHFQEDVQEQLRRKASVFERLGGPGNVVSPQKRANPCTSWMNTGKCSRDRHCPYLHPPLSPETSGSSNYQGIASRHGYPNPIRSSYPHQNETNAHHYPRPHYRQDIVDIQEEPRKRSSSSSRYSSSRQTTREHGHGHHQERVGTRPEEHDRSRERHKRSGRQDIDIEDETLKRSSSSKPFSSSRQTTREHGHGHGHYPKRSGSRQEESDRSRERYKRSGRDGGGEDRRRRNGHDGGYSGSVGSVDEEFSDHENAKLRSKVVVTKSKVSHPADMNGPSTSARHLSHIPRNGDVPGDNRDQESEEALNQKLKDLKRQLRELDEEAVPPKEDRATLDQRELEPISDEEVDEVGSEEASVVRGEYDGMADTQVTGQPSTSKIGENNLEKALSAQWAEALPGNGRMNGKLSSSDRRQNSDASSFLPTISTCAEYLDAMSLEEATRTLGDGANDIDVAMKKYSAIRRLRQLGSVGSAYRKAMSARVDLKLRRQICGLVPEADLASNTMELSVHLNGRTFRKALSSFEKWTSQKDDLETGDQSRAADEFRTSNL